MKIVVYGPSRLVERCITAFDVKLHAPRATAARVACAGGNFADHAAAMSERAVRRGDRAVFEGEPYQAIRNLGIWGFWKIDRESLGQDGVIPYPDRCKRLDYT
jgi:2-keto-4-pentenoate hydratase/2-oxohepta-3-ene-1,7-dioic acid hydratase in catechol pathway